MKNHTYSNNMFILSSFKTRCDSDSMSAISSHYENLSSFLCEYFKIALYV